MRSSRLRTWLLRMSLGPVLLVLFLIPGGQWLGFRSGESSRDLGSRFERARVTAEMSRLRDLYQWLNVYKTNHRDAWPEGRGQGFLLPAWQERCQDPLRDDPARSPWGGNRYAAFDPGDDTDLPRLLNRAPGQITIVANATFAHRDTLLYMTADGDIHELSVAELLEKGILTQDVVDSGVVPVGPGSPIRQLRTVSAR